MALKGNQGKVIVQRNNRLYTGVALMKLVAVNPTLAELKALGINYNKEPSYTERLQDKEGRFYIRAAVHLWMRYQLPDETYQTAPIVIFLENRDHVSTKKRKVEYINKYGATVWGDPGVGVPQDASWFKPEGARPAFVGESSLIGFLQAFLNISRDDECTLDHWDRFFRGDFEELKVLPAMYPENSVHCMLTVALSPKDKKYHQNIYARFFTRWNIDDPNVWIEHIERSNTSDGVNRAFPPNVTYSVPLQEFVIATEVTNPDSDEAARVPATPSSEDDIPF